MAEDLFPGYHWNGEYEGIEVMEYYCPTQMEWNMCSGPCPDGTPHEPTRTRTVHAKKMVPDG